MSGAIDDAWRANLEEHVPRHEIMDLSLLDQVVYREIRAGTPGETIKWESRAATVPSGNSRRILCLCAGLGVN